MGLDSLDPAPAWGPAVPCSVCGQPATSRTPEDRPLCQWCREAERLERVRRATAEGIENARRRRRR